MSFNSRSGRVWWSEPENKQLLTQIGKLGVIRALVRKRQKNADIFKVVESKMKRLGSNKTWQQIRSRWKRMKSEYIREKKLRNAKTKETETDDAFFEEMTKVLGKYADRIEFTSAYLGEEPEPLRPICMSDCNYSDNGDDGEVQVQVELIEGDAALEHSITTDGPEVLKIKTEKITPPASPMSTASHHEDVTDHAQEEKTPEASQPKKTVPVPSDMKAFAAEIAKKHSMHLREMQDQYITWYERQVEAQQQWEESFVREQMDLAKTMMESVTSTFLQGMQQILQNIVSNAGQRTITPMLPNYQRPDLNGLVDLPMFFNSNGTEHSNGYTSENSSSQEK